MSTGLLYHRSQHPENPTLFAVLAADVEPDGAFLIKWVRFDTDTEGGRLTGETIREEIEKALEEKGFDLAEVTMQIEELIENSGGENERD